MADCWVRLGFAVIAIALITAALYQFSSRPAVAIEPPSLLLSAK